MCLSLHIIRYAESWIWILGAKSEFVCCFSSEIALKLWPCELRRLRGRLYVDPFAGRFVFGCLACSMCMFYGCEAHRRCSHGCDNVTWAAPTRLICMLLMTSKIYIMWICVISISMLNRSDIAPLLALSITSASLSPFILSDTLASNCADISVEYCSNSQMRCVAMQTNCWQV